MADKTYKPSPKFIGSEGEYSIGQSGPEAIKDDILDIMRMFDPTSKHPKDANRGYAEETQGGIGYGNLNFNFADSDFAGRIGVTLDGQESNVQAAFNKLYGISLSQEEAHKALEALHSADVSALHKLIDDLKESKQDKLTFDTAPTAGSNNPVTSGGIKSALDTKENAADAEEVYASVSEKLKNLSSETSALTSRTNQLETDKQDKLTFDATPTANSANPVTSGGVKSALDLKENADEATATHTALSKDIANLKSSKQDKLTFDNAPTATSNNPVTSDGIKSALDKKADVSVTSRVESLETDKQDKLTFDNEPTADSANPVTSAGVKSYVDDAIETIVKDEISTSFGYATATKAGVVKVGNNLSVDEDGVLSADAQEVDTTAITEEAHTYADAKASTAESNAKTYTDTEVGKSLPKSGGTMSGDLILNADPTTDLQATTKRYVDSMADYDVLRNKPSIDNVELTKDTTLEQLGLRAMTTDELLKILV